MTQDLAGTADDQTLTFSHNPAHQLASRTATNAGYAWAGHVNVNEVTTVNGLNQVATEAGVSFGYDARGNLTSDGETSYWYDADNRLTGATGGVPFAYDALGRLYEASGNGMAATRFLHDGSELIAEYDTSGNLQRRFVHGPRSDEPLVWYEGASTSDRRWLITDERGSVIAVTDDAGDAMAINTYDEYGQPGAGNLGRFQYTGQAWIEAVGLYYYKARFYASAQGRFLQTDPIGYGDGLNLYGYAGGDPVNRVDPSGTDDQEVEKEEAEEPPPPYPNVTVSEEAPDPPDDPWDSIDGSTIVAALNSSNAVVSLLNFWANQVAGEDTGSQANEHGSSAPIAEIIVTAPASERLIAARISAMWGGSLLSLYDFLQQIGVVRGERLPSVQGVIGKGPTGVIASASGSSSVYFSYGLASTGAAGSVATVVIGMPIAAGGGLALGHGVNLLTEEVSGRTLSSHTLDAACYIGLVYGSGC